MGWGVPSGTWEDSVFAGGAEDSGEEVAGSAFSAQDANKSRQTSRQRAQVKIRFITGLLSHVFLPIIQSRSENSSQENEKISQKAEKVSL
jgi:hypothetical protein